MNKALQTIQNWANRRSCYYKAFTGRANDLMTPRGMNISDIIKIEQQGRSLFLILLDSSEKFHIIKLSTIEIADAYSIEVSHELKKVGVRQI